jgi:DNA repair protein RecO (recombination protein O)
MKERYLAIILGKTNIGETDRLYSFYTLENGKMVSYARGVRKSTSKLAGHLETFSLANLMIARQRGLGNIASSIVENNFYALRENLTLFQTAFFHLRLFNELTQEDQAEKNLFFLFKNYLFILNHLAELKTRSEINVEDLILKSHLTNAGFLVKLFFQLGFALQLEKCQKCQKNNLNRLYYFDFSAGSLICQNCLDNLTHISRRSIIAIRHNTIKLFRLCAQNKLKSLLKIKIQTQDLQNAQQILQGFSEWIK